MPRLPNLQTQRVAQLTSGLKKYHTCFYEHIDWGSEEIQGETDPYFKLLAICSSYGSASKAIDDDNLFYWLEKTLKAWQMNRGLKGGSLAARGAMKNSLRSPEIRQAIKGIEDLSISDLRVLTPPVFQTLQKAMWGICITNAESKIVANSKTLHFLMPSLVPPIDRRYTMRFFYDRDVSPALQIEAFEQIFKQFHLIAISDSNKLRELVHSHPFDTGEAKVIDNAIIGYCIEEGLVEKRGARLSHP